ATGEECDMITDRDEGVVVVVGGGLAGLTAGCHAAELGLPVTLLEQGTDPSYECNSRITSGTLLVGGRDVTIPPDELYDALVQATFGAVEPALGHLLADRAAEAVAWLEARDVPVERVRGGAMAVLSPPPTHVTADYTGFGPDVALRALARRLSEAGATVLLGHRVTGLLTGSDEVAGVTFERADGSTGELRARAVILAD